MSAVEDSQNSACQEAKNICKKRTADTRTRQKAIETLYDTLERLDFNFQVLIKNFYCFGCKSISNKCDKADHKCQVNAFTCN